jgi:aspartate kinase
VRGGYPSSPVRRPPILTSHPPPSYSLRLRFYSIAHSHHPGFFGPLPPPLSLLTTVGRGYTDLLASLCAAGLSAQELQIWKEVDGIFTADPRKVPTARLLPMITPEEAGELTFFGSEVVHPFTMEQVSLPLI